MLTRLPLPLTSPRVPLTQARAIRSAVGLLLLTAGAAMFAGATVAGKTQTYFGSQTALLAVAMLAVGALFVTFGTIGFPVLIVWAVTTGLAYPFIRYGSKVTFDRLWIIGMVGSLALAERVRGHSRESRAFLLGFAIFTATFGLRALTTRDGTNAPVELWVDAVVLPLILFLTTRRFAREPRRAIQVAGALMVGGGIIAVLGLATPVAGVDLAKYGGGTLRIEGGTDVVRLSGPYPAPEPFAVVVLVCLAATCYWLLSHRGRGTRLIGLAFAALELTAIGLTLFRAAWIGAVFVVVAAFGLRPRRFGRLLLVAGVVAALALSATTQLEHSSLFQQRVNNSDNIYGRFATYEQGLQVFKSAPLFGVGVNQYHAVTEQLVPKLVNGVQSVTYPHSSFVGLLAEQGIVGFVPFLLVCFLAARLLRGLIRRAADGRDAALAGAASGAAVAYLVMSATLTMLPYGPSNAFLAVLLGIVAARLDASPATNAIERVAPTPTAAARTR